MDPERHHNRRVHMANERTFLAWIRTSLGLMAFGFVVERFSLFVRQMSLIFQQEKFKGMEAMQQPRGYSAVLGVMLVGLGAVMGLLSFVRYKKIEKQIDDDVYRPSFLLDVLLTLTILAVGAFLVFYLAQSI